MTKLNPHYNKPPNLSFWDFPSLKILIFAIAVYDRQSQFEFFK